MKVKIKEKLGFIHCNDLLEFDIEPLNGVYVLRSGKFKQNLKKSEYDKIMAVCVIDKKETAKDKKAREKEEAAIKDKEDAEAREKADADAKAIKDKEKADAKDKAEKLKERALAVGLPKDSKEADVEKAEAKKSVDGVTGSGSGDNVPC